MQTDFFICSERLWMAGNFISFYILRNNSGTIRKGQKDSLFSALNSAGPSALTQTEPEKGMPVSASRLFLERNCIWQKDQIQRFRI